VEWFYETLYCARGQMENFIKLHKTQLASDRTSCRSPLANQVRLVLHTGAYWLLLKVRGNIPRLQPLATAEFKTLQMRLIKIAARISETATRVRICFRGSLPRSRTVRRLGAQLPTRRTMTRGACAPASASFRKPQRLAFPF
jgi:hypothetical protein